MARMTMTKAMKHYAPTFEETFERFLSNRKAKGLSDKTLQTYHYHFRAISKYLDADKDLDLITKTDLEQMLAEMRDGGLSSNSINSYTRTLKSFFSWCNEEEITTLNLRLYKAEETVKDTYTDAELQADNFQLIKSAAQILRRDNQRIAFRETQTIYIENSLKSYDFSGFSGRSVIIGFQKTQIYQRFAGSRQEVFILRKQF